MEPADKYSKYNDEYMDENSYDNEYIDEEEVDPEYTDEYYSHCTRKIEVEEVVGFGHSETTAEVCIPLNPFAFEVMENAIEKRLVFDAVIAGKNKVFINARLIKNIPYKTRAAVVSPGCRNISRLTFGDVRHATAEIPVALCIDVPGAKKGDKVVVLKSEIESVEILNHLGCAPESCVGICEPAILKFDDCQRRLIRSITEKDCISVKVKVVKPVIISIPEMSGKEYNEEYRNK